MQRLLQTTKYESFEMNYQVDASLIGGMVIRIGDRVVDTSIKTKLYELSKKPEENSGIAVRISRKKVDSLHEFKTRRNKFCDQRTD